MLSNRRTAWAEPAKIFTGGLFLIIGLMICFRAASKNGQDFSYLKCTGKFVARRQKTLCSGKRRTDVFDAFRIHSQRRICRYFLPSNHRFSGITARFTTFQDSMGSLADFVALFTSFYVVAIAENSCTKSLSGELYTDSRSRCVCKQCAMRECSHIALLFYPSLACLTMLIVYHHYYDGILLLLAFIVILHPRFAPVRSMHLLFGSPLLVYLTHLTQSDVRKAVLDGTIASWTSNFSTSTQTI